jgi:hypothetical protein
LVGLTCRKSRTSFTWSLAEKDFLEKLVKKLGPARVARVGDLCGKS